MALARSRAAAGLVLEEQARGFVTSVEGPGGPRRQPGEEILERFPVKEGGRVYFVRASAIDWIESADNYVRLHTGGTSHLVRRTLAQVEAELDPARFARIHRGTIVNLDRVREIQPGIGRFRLVLLENGAQLRLSERYFRQLGYANRAPRLSRNGSRRS
jgi:two-component system LytT family response regulator